MTKHQQLQDHVTQLQKAYIKVEYKMKYNLHFIKVFRISLQTLRNNLLYNSIVKITLKLPLRRIRYLLV